MVVEKPNRSDDKFWKLFNLSLAGIFLAHLPGGEIMEINDTFLKMVEHTRREVIGRTSAEVGWLDVDEREKMIELFFANGGLLVDYEITVTAKSGRKRIALYSATMTEFNGEKCVLVTVQDISARKKAEQQIKESEEKFRKLYNISHVGISLAHMPRGEIIEINDAYLGMIGYTRDEVIGRISSEVGWLDADERRKMIDAFLAQNRLDDYEIGFTTRSGQHGVALFSGVAIELSGETCVLTTVQDITQRKKAEEKLRESEAKFRKVFDISHAGIALLNRTSYSIIEINDAYLNMVEYPREDVIGRTSSEVGWLEPWVRQDMLDTARDTNGELRNYEANFTRASGRIGTALISATPIEINKVECLLVTVQDITERKKAEEKLKESEERFRKVFDLSHTGISLLNRSSLRILEINDAYLKIVERSRSDVIGRTSLEVGWMAPWERQEMIDKARENKDELRDYEANFTRASGLAGTGLFSATPIEINREECLLVTLQDITERKKAEQQIKENEEKYRKLFDLSQTGIALLHFPSGIYREINDAFLNMIEYKRDEVLGRTSSDVGWFDAAERQKVIDKFYAGTGAIRDYEVGYTKKSGKKGAAMISFDKIEVNQEECVLVSVMDITHRLEGEKKKTELLEQLKQANQDLESFSFSVSHDLRAPLRAITGYIQMIQHKYQESLNEDEKGLIDRIRDQTKRMGHLIEDLLAFARQNKSEITKGLVNMNELVKGVLDDNDLGGKEIILNDLLPAIGDSQALKQVFVNFITNALKYSGKKEHPVIEIGSYTEGTENIYFVKDNGAGFDMKYYDQLFQVFHRLHTQQEFEGSGVGLAIVSKIIAKHGGRVWAEGMVDEGATFYFSLPRE